MASECACARWDTASGVVVVAALLAGNRSRRTREAPPLGARGGFRGVLVVPVGLGGEGEREREKGKGRIS